MKTLRKVYCIGLGGIGVSAVAKYYLAQGATVFGSDPIRSVVVDEVVAKGAQYYPTVEAAHITPDVDLVVYSEAVRADDPERHAAEQQGIPCQPFAAALADIMEQYGQRVAICGTNGKSTTTGLAGLLATDARLDPTVFVGSRVTNFNGNLRLGGPALFIAEADEYYNHFLFFHPTILTILNIEHDHPDFFPDLAAVVKSFQTMVDRLPADGTLVLNADDSGVAQLNVAGRRMITFGWRDGADLQITNLEQQPGQQKITFCWQEKILGPSVLHLPGRFNVANVAAAMATALVVGADPGTFVKTINTFTGVWRRFEVLNPKGDVTIINDYAHHPTSVQATLEGAKAFYPNRRIIGVFQPHHHIRLTTLFDHFAQAFGAADVAMIVEVYGVLGRNSQNSESKTGRDLADALKQPGRLTSYAPDAAAAAEQLRKIIQPGDVVILMSAGDLWTIGQPLAGHYA